MTSIDEKIKQALNNEFNEIIDENDKINSSFLKQFDAHFKGNMKKIYTIGYFFIVLFYLACAYSLYKFGTHSTDDIKTLVAWASASIFFGIASLMGEFWHMTEIGRNRVMRELKIVELQLSQVIKNQE